MKKIALFFALISITGIVHALSGQAYLERFIAYQQWSKNLPQQPDPEFLNFIEGDTSLAVKLRNRWLYLLAQKKDWSNYSKYYRPSKDVTLQCFDLLAKYHQGNTNEALASSRLLWLNGESQPPVCNMLFDLLVKSDKFDERLISQRIILALEKRNISLARYLLKQYKSPRLKDEQLLALISQSPSRINQITPGELHDQFYLFGLKRLVSVNMDLAISYWKNAKTKQLLNEAQQQSFLSHLAIYKSMRNHEDAPEWFAKIKSVFYNEVLLDWQIRFALKHEEWAKVEHLINDSPEKEKPCWRYWLARALEAQGQAEKAKEIYQSIAKTRHYYGFLASMRLNTKPSFENERPISNLSLLKPYRPITDNIKALYNNNQSMDASRLINDFISELPKDDKSAFIYWLATELQWYEKSLYLSSTDEMNNQLALRFPLIYQDSIRTYSKSYSIPQEFIYAIIRQESGFRDSVVSPVGARGLMQVMPKTASMVAKKERIAYVDPRQLFTSHKNINIGVAYLKQLTRSFHAHPVLIAAAYNAGPHQVHYWLKNHPPKEMDIWIDTLPWHETRNYLKNIMAFYAVYQFRLQQRPDLSLFMQPL